MAIVSGVVSLIEDIIWIIISEIQANPLSALTFLGIIPTIMLGYSSMNHQRRNAVRESIEQLDDLSLGTSLKIKAILHEFPKWPWRYATVKLQILNPVQPGISQPHGRFYMVPRSRIEDFSIETTPDGYILHLDSANPVVIRNSIEELFERINQANQTGRGIVPYDQFLSDYSSAYDGERIPVYDEIIKQLSYFDAVHISNIRNALDYDDSIVNCALQDLLHDGEIQTVSNHMNRFYLTPDWDDICKYHF